MLRRTFLTRCSKTTTSSAAWNSIRDHSRQFRPPILHVLYDSDAKHRFCTATVDLTGVCNNSNSIPDTKSGFLVWDGPAETTLTAKHSDPIPFDPDSIALFGCSELLTTATTSENGDTNGIDAAARRVKRSLQEISQQQQHQQRGDAAVPSKLFLMRFDRGEWFRPGQRDVIMRNLDANPTLKIVCGSSWYAALKSQDGLEALLAKTTNPKSSNNSSNNNNKTLASPRIPTDRLQAMKPGETVSFGKREVCFVAESWCAAPVFEDTATKSIFSAAGVAATLPWMELFAASFAAANCTRAHPPFVFPFWSEADSSSSSSLSIDAKQSRQLVQYLLQRSPQRLFLERYGLVSPADEFLEKLEVIAGDLALMQERLSAKIATLSSMDEQRRLERRVTERIAQTLLVGGGGADGASVQERQWANLEELRQSQPKLDAALSFVTQSIAEQLTQPFLRGAKMLLQPAKQQRPQVQAQQQQVPKKEQQDEEADSADLEIVEQTASTKKKRGAPKKQKQAAATTAAAAAAKYFSPTELSNLVKSRVTSGDVAQIVVKEEIDSEVFVAMSEQELKTVFNSPSFGVLKKLVYLQKSLN